MKHKILISAAICALTVLPTLAATAMPLVSVAPAASQADHDTIQVGYGGRGRHYGWGGNRGHHYHYGWSRGRHRGWHASIGQPTFG